MKEIKIKVQDKIATLVEDVSLVCGNSDYSVIFDFDEDWVNHGLKTAVFVFGDSTVEVPFTGNILEEKDAVAIEGATKCYIGVYSGDLITTTKAEIKCTPSIRDIAKKHKTPTKDIYNRLIELINSISEGGLRVIISVDELPEEKISTNSFYKTPQGLYWYDEGWNFLPTGVDLDNEINRATEKENEIEGNLEETRTLLNDEIERLDGKDKELQDALAEFKSKVNAILQVSEDDVLLDELQEIVDYIKNNKNLIDAITINKVNVKDIIDNLTSNETQKPLSANQGAILSELINEEVTRAKEAEAKSVKQKEYSNDEYNPTFNDGDCARAYVRSLNNTEDSILVSKYTKIHSIPLRNEKGNLFTLEPTSSNECTNKTYVDNIVSKKQDNLAFDGTYNANSNKVATVETVVRKIAETDFESEEVNSAIKKNADEIAKEISRAKGVEETLSSSIKENNTLAQNAYNIASEAKTSVASTQELLDAESTRATKKENEISLALETHKGNYDAKISSIEQFNATEAQKLSSHITNYNEKVHNLEVESQNQANAIESLEGKLDSFDDATLESIQEVVDYVNENKELIDSITTNKVNVSDVVDNLLSTEPSKPLSANQGRVLDEKKENKGEITITDGNQKRLFIGTTKEYEELQDKSDLIALFTDDPQLAKLNLMAEEMEQNSKDIYEEEKRAKAAEAKAVQQEKYSNLIVTPHFYAGNDGNCARAYVRMADDKEGTIIVSKYAKQYAIPIRNEKGNLFTLTPEDRNECANKEYVDNAVKDIEVDTVGTKELIYTLSDDGTYYICSGIENKTLESVVIPSMHKGLLVTHIGDNAFEDCSSLKSIAIPDSITHIGDTSFHNCTGLTSITLGNNVKSIGRGAFYTCKNLKSVTLPNTVETIGHQAFYGCQSLLSIDIPKGVKVIDNQTFEWCTNLRSVTIPDSVTTIDDYAFKKCTWLHRIYIPYSVTTIGGSVFADCPDLSIYCQASSKPSGWSENWNVSNCEVIWDVASFDVWKSLYSKRADYALSASTAGSAGNAQWAEQAGKALNATNATYATYDSDGNNINQTYARIGKTLVTSDTGEFFFEEDVEFLSRILTMYMSLEVNEEINNSTFSVNFCVPDVKYGVTKVQQSCIYYTKSSIESWGGIFACEIHCGERNDGTYIEIRYPKLYTGGSTSNVLSNRPLNITSSQLRIVYLLKWKELI